MDGSQAAVLVAIIVVLLLALGARNRRSGASRWGDDGATPTVIGLTAAAHASGAIDDDAGGTGIDTDVGGSGGDGGGGNGVGGGN